MNKSRIFCKYFVNFIECSGGDRETFSELELDLGRVWWWEEVVD